MFTGIVEAMGQVIDKQPGTDSIRLVVEAGAVAEGVRLGDSVAINGCCLTVVNAEGSRLTFDLLAETEQRTNLKSAVAGNVINLERALRADARLGGHFVTGHIDGTGKIARWEKKGNDYALEVLLTPEQAKYVVMKGCIAIDGISLTVAAVAKARLGVWIIPHTREVTALRERKLGDDVNLEFDLLAKYTEKILASRS